MLDAGVRRPRPLTLLIAQPRPAIVAFLSMSVVPFGSMAAKRGPRSMTDEHKQALADGRTQGRAVRNYLDALEFTKPKRGRKRTAESINKRLATIESELAATDPLKALNLRQERRDLQAELAGMGEKIDLADVATDFLTAAESYRQRL